MIEVLSFFIFETALVSVEGSCEALVVFGPDRRLLAIGRWLR